MSICTIISWTLTRTHELGPGKTQILAGLSDTILEKFVNYTWKAILTFTKDRLLAADPLAGFVACYENQGAIVKAEKLKLNIVLHGEKVGLSEATPSEDGCIVVKEVNFEMYKNVWLTMMKHR